MVEPSCTTAVEGVSCSAVDNGLELLDVDFTRPLPHPIVAAQMIMTNKIIMALQCKEERMASITAVLFRL